MEIANYELEDEDYNGNIFTTNFIRVLTFTNANAIVIQTNQTQFGICNCT